MRVAARAGPPLWRPLLTPYRHPNIIGPSMNSTECTNALNIRPQITLSLAKHLLAVGMLLTASLKESSLFFIKPLISSLFSSSYKMGKNQAPRMMTGSGGTVRGIFPPTGTVGAHPHHGRARSSFRRSSSLRPTWELTYLVSRMWLAFSSPSPPLEKQATDA